MSILSDALSLTRSGWTVADIISLARTGGVPTGSGASAADPAGSGVGAADPAGSGDSAADPAGSGDSAADPASSGGGTADPAGSGDSAADPASSGGGTADPAAVNTTGSRDSEKSPFRETAGKVATPAESWEEYIQELSKLF